MPIIVRPARGDELERAQGLVVGSINDLTERHGFGPMASVRPPHFQLFSIKDDPAGLWVAEDGDDMVGFAFGWVCGELWFLAELFVSPAHQGLGIGNELLKRTLDHARTSGATNKALITFTFNLVSQGLYIRHGLYPRLPIYNFSAASQVLKPRLQGTPCRCVPIEPAHLPMLEKIDARVLGLSREKHHRYLISDAAMKGALLYEGDDCIGYAYVSAGGHVGPLAAAKPEDIGRVFKTALRLALDNDAAQVSAFIPGGSAAALDIAATHGMRITFPMVLVSSRDFGDWASYMPRNPGFM